MLIRKKLKSLRLGKDLIGSFLFVICPSFSAFAVDICLDRAYINIDADNDCGAAPTECPLVTGCTVGGPENISCISFTCEVCCPDTMNDQREDVSEAVIVTDVPAGDEQVTAQ